jgi:tetratricopeptide (TPR) repeat protein
MTVSSLRRLAACPRAAIAVIAFLGPAAAAQPAAPASPPAPAASAPAPVVNSAIDAPLFYQLLIGEIELRTGQAGTAYQIMLDAARRTGDERLFRRATEIALQGRAGEQALVATRAWRAARPQSMEAIQLQLQILLSMNRIDELPEPLRALVAGTPAAERGAVIAALPRFMHRATEKRRVATLLEDVLQPYLADAGTRAAARSAIGRAWLAAGEPARALELARQALAADPAAGAAVQLALELMPTRPEAEALVADYLKSAAADPALRRAYAGTLLSLQRYADAIAQLQIVTTQQPDQAGPWLTLGALQLELRQTQAAEQSLQRYVDLVQAQPAAASAGDDKDDDDTSGDGTADRGLTQAWLLLAKAAEQRGDFATAEARLARVDSPQRALEVQTRRASLLARQGRVPQARELVRSVPERNPGDARAKLLAEAQVLREVKQWSEAYAVLQAANQRFPNDSDLLYEQAMMAEKIDRLGAMESLLRQVMALKPDHAHAYNALGYSLADRNLRLGEAKALIERALQLSPGDPFITDSLGWVEFRLGNRDEALRLLRQAYNARPDAEIGAHLGEVLWALGQRDEARRIWAEASSRDAGNDVLRETMVRLKAQ